MTSNDFFIVLYCVLWSAGQREKLNGVMQEWKASSEDRLEQEAHHLGLCLDKHWHFMKFILWYGISNDCLYVSPARSRRLGTSPRPLWVCSEKRPVDSGGAVVYKRDKQEKQSAQLLSFVWREFLNGTDKLGIIMRLISLKSQPFFRFHI